MTQPKKERSLGFLLFTLAALCFSLCTLLALAWRGE